MGGLSIIFCNEPDFVAVERGVVLLDVLIYCVFALGAAVWERDFGGVELPGGLERPEGGGGRGGGGGFTLNFVSCSEGVHSFLGLAQSQEEK